MTKVYNFTAKLFATGLGTGYCPIVPGTIGSLLGVALYFVLVKLEPSAYISIIVVLFFVGVFTATRAEKLFEKKDARQIVIDEVVGCLISLLFIPRTNWCIIIGFVIFRIFDIIKPFPANASQRLPGGWGIMVDDLIAGIYTAVVINIVVFIRRGFLC